MRRSESLSAEARAATVRADVTKATQLVNRTYQGPFKLFAGSGQYLGHGFALTVQPASGQPDNTVWVARFGQYNALQGYWLFLPYVNKCWQAESANGPLRYWNQDGLASGNPEDWELFVFKAVDLSGAVVKVANIYGAYVRYSGSGFSADGDVNNASPFVVE